MVGKLCQSFGIKLPMFESSVNSYGRKTPMPLDLVEATFESSVNSYGRKTVWLWIIQVEWFESSVNSYGRKTKIQQSKARG